MTLAAAHVFPRRRRARLVLAPPRRRCTWRSRACRSRSAGSRPSSACRCSSAPASGARADRGRAAVAAARRAHARRGAGGAGVRARGARRSPAAPSPSAFFGSAHHYLLGGLVAGLPRASTRRCACAWSARTRPRWPTPSATAQLEAGLVVLPIEDRGLDVRPVAAARSCSTSPPTRERVREPMTIERLAAGAADPLRRALGGRGPDPPPAARARPARRRDARAADRGRVHDRGARPRRARPRRHGRRRARC